MHYYRMNEMVILDMPFLRHFPQPYLTLSKPSYCTRTRLVAKQSWSPLWRQRRQLPRAAATLSLARSNKEVKDSLATTAAAACSAGRMLQSAICSARVCHSCCNLRCKSVDPARLSKFHILWGRNKQITFFDHFVTAPRPSQNDYAMANGRVPRSHKYWNRHLEDNCSCVMAIGFLA